MVNGFNIIKILRVNIQLQVNAYQNLYNSLSQQTLNSGNSKRKILGEQWRFVNLFFFRYPQK